MLQTVACRAHSRRPHTSCDEDCGTADGDDGGDGDAVADVVVGGCGERVCWDCVAGGDGGDGVGCDDGAAVVVVVRVWLAMGDADAGELARIRMARRARMALMAVPLVMRWVMARGGGAECDAGDAADADDDDDDGGDARG